MVYHSTLLTRLPFGKGMRFANGIGGVANAVIGGWKMGGVYAYQVGFPVAFWD